MNYHLCNESSGVGKADCGPAVSVEIDLTQRAGMEVGPASSPRPSQTSFCLSAQTIAESPRLPLPMSLPRCGQAFSCWSRGDDL